MNTKLSLTVNGIKHTLEPIPGETLSALLRERLRLTGTKIGCDEAECGACTVLVGGEPVDSCMYPADRADGKTILTIEGLAGEFTAKDAKKEERHLHRTADAVQVGKKLGALSELHGSEILHPLQEAF